MATPKKPLVTDAEFRSLEMTARPLDQWVTEELAKPGLPWLLHNMVMPGGLTIVAGRAKLGKSFWTMIMGIAMATGRPFGPIQPVGRSRCLYLDLEGVARKTAERVGLICQGMDVSLGGLSLFMMADQREFQLLEPGAAARLANCVRAHNIDTVFIDTFARSFSGDENNKKEAQKFLDTLSEVRAATGCAVVLVHHVNKAFFGAKDVAVMMDPDAGLRGSSAIAGAYDVIVTLQDGWVEGEFQKFATSRGKYTDDWWCSYEVEGEKDVNDNWTQTWLTFGKKRDEFALIERGPTDKQPSFGGRKSYPTRKDTE